jgi:hypothetical protein
LDVYELVRVPSEKAAEFYSKHGTLTSREKQHYKRVLSFLSEVFEKKKIFAKNNSEKAKLAKNAADAAKFAAEHAKFAAEEKKWNDIYDSIKN